MADLGFPRWGCQPLSLGWKPIIWQFFFSENWMKMKTVGPRGGTHPWIRQWTRMRESNSEKRRYVVDELDLFWINRIEKKRLLETEYHPICLSFVNPFIPSFVHSLFSSYFYHRIFIVTVRNSSCGKVMFSHVSVCPQRVEVHTPRWADTTTPGQTPPGRHPPGQTSL